MNSIDLRVLCLALGFTAVVTQGGKLPTKEGASRATAVANLIEKFCRASIADAFEGKGESDMRVIDLEI